MRRREFVALLSGAAIARPLGARAEQSEPLRQVGVLSLPPETCPRSLEWDAAFRKRLNELGWVDSHNLHLDCRYGARARWQCRAHAAIRRRAGGA
jgi:putative tryptophan/tyrosine transport system substrate-binding protein